MKLSALLAPLLDAHADHELIRKQILAYEAEQSDGLERRRQHERERQARKRERQAMSRDITGQPRDRLLVRAVEDKPLPTDNNKPTKTNTHTEDLAAFKAALAGECDSERIDAFVKLRKTKRGQNTGHAAVLFKAAAAKCGLSIPEAIDTCIRRNWITVEPEWLAKPQARAGPRRNELADAFGAMSRAQNDQSSEQVSGVILNLPAAASR